MFHTDVLYHFMPEKSLNPYLIAGLGAARIRPIKGDSYNTLMEDFGAGFKYFLTENFAFRAEARDVITRSHNMVVSAGITLAFGGKPHKEPAPPSVPPAATPEPKAEIKPGSEAETAPEIRPEPIPEAAPVLTPLPETKPELKPEQKPAGTDVVAKPGPSGMILEDVYFAFNKATLTSAARKTLKKNVQIIKQNKGIRIQIEGHACAHGADVRNMTLSDRRANKVKEYLMRQGISADKLTTIGYGETRLAMPEIPTRKNRNSKEAAANRRVHFEVIVK